LNKKDKIFIEVKNVTLSRQNELAEFPDAETTRGLKHINELIKASKKNFKVYILYLIQRDDCKIFKIAKDIDSNYANALNKADKKKLKLLCYDCKFSSKGIKLNNKIEIK
jgi:sugar fermentation stimulation protein A